MTEWQWRVLLALIRYVLRRDGIDITSMYDTQTTIEDVQVLHEAAIRGE